MQTKNTRGVQQHEVSAAADALVAERQRPTIERIRQKLGRGSPNTIAPMLEAWFADLAPRLGVAVDSGGEDAIPSEVRNAAEVLWHSALALAESRAAQTLHSEREVVENEKLELAMAQAAVVALREQVTHHESTLRTALTDAQMQVEDAKKRVQSLEVELARKDGELGQLRDTVAKSVLERDADRRRFDEQLQATTQEREKQQERATGTERRLLEEVDRARQETKFVRLELTSLGKKHEGVLVELLRIQQLLQQVIGEHKVLVAALSEKLAAAEQRVRDFKEALKAAPAVKKTPVSGKKPRNSIPRSSKLASNS